MALKTNLSLLTFSFIVVIATNPFHREPAQALNTDAASASAMEAFTGEIKDGEPGELRGVFVADLIAARVVRQPAADYNFVSSKPGVVTQFTLASRLGSTGLLAHNFLAGESFSNLTKGQKIYLIYGDGQVSAFTVIGNLRYQALQPSDPLGEFVDLENGVHQAATEVFTRVYDRPGHVILQTCISGSGNSSWGRLFVIAAPDQSTSLPSALESFPLLAQP